jgi:hypothetical protein
MYIRDKNKKRKMDESIPAKPKRTFWKKASGLVGIGGLVLLGSCSAYNLPKTVLDEARQCQKRMGTDDPETYDCLLTIAEKKSTDQNTRKEIIKYYGKLLRSDSLDTRNKAMAKLAFIAEADATGPSEREMIINLFDEALRVKHSLLFQPLLGPRIPNDDDHFRQIHAARFLLRLAMEPTIERHLREQIIVILEYPWEKMEFVDDAGWGGYRKFQHKMSDGEFRERTISILERAVSIRSNRQMSSFCVEKLVKFSEDDRSNSAERMRIFGILENFWSNGYIRATRYHANAWEERDDCNGDDLLESLYDLAMAEKTNPQIRERLVNFLDPGSKRSCFDNPYAIHKLQSIAEDTNTSPALKERVMKIIERLQKDPKTKLQDEDRKNRWRSVHPSH